MKCKCVKEDCSNRWECLIECGIELSSYLYCSNCYCFDCFLTLLKLDSRYDMKLFDKKGMTFRSTDRHRPRLNGSTFWDIVGVCYPSLNREYVMKKIIANML